MVYWYTHLLMVGLRKLVSNHYVCECSINEHSSPLPDGGGGGVFFYDLL